MSKKHACPTFPHFIHGADYNPEQWIFDKSVWDRDMALLQEANCNELSVGIFSWAALEPEEGVYDFSFLDEIIGRVKDTGGKVILATPSGARPRWMAEKYPEVLRVGRDDVREHFRARHNHCLTSPVYRQKVRQMNEQLALRYGNDPTVIAWHISNEYGGECRCELCVNAFREYLKEKFGGDIGKLNRAYWTSFWSHTYQSFDQIEPPGDYAENATHGLNLDWHRFVTRQTKSFIENEIEPIRRHSPHLPVTINMMYGFYDLNYHEIGKVIDIASWDAYPEWHSTGDDGKIASETAFWHDFYRTLKGRPFLLMESTPSLVNWKPYNKLKRPGLDVLSSLQAVAHGSDSVQYFQWRKSRGSSEKLHGAVVGHDGTANTRVFRSVQKTGEILKSIDEVAGTVTNAKVAVVFDWENMWALDDCQGFANAGKKYFETCYSYHRVLWEKGVDCDIVSPKADLSGYKLVIAPMLYLYRENIPQKLREFTAAGGTLIGTYWSGLVDENDLCYESFAPYAMHDVFGLKSDEIDCLYPQQHNRMLWDGEEYQISDLCDLVSVTTAQVLATYGDDFYAGMPALTRNVFGDGQAYYLCARADSAFCGKFYRELAEQLQLERALDAELPEGVTAALRKGSHDFVAVQNFTAMTQTVSLKAAVADVETGEAVSHIQLRPYQIRFFQK
jgi:beta-galactosidase